MTEAEEFHRWRWPQGTPSNVIDAVPALIRKAATEAGREARPNDDEGKSYTDLEMAVWCRENGWPYLTADERLFILEICLSLRHQRLTSRQSSRFECIVAKLNDIIYPHGGAA